MKRIELFVFDMDGVIFEKKNFWFDLHSVYGNLREALHFYKSNISSGNDYPDVFKRMGVLFWSGIEVSLYRQLIANRAYSQDIFELVNFLKASGIKIAIVSSGPWELAERAQAELGIEYIYANQLEISDEVFTGNCRLMVDNDDKMKAVEHLLEQLSIDRKNVAFIGDSSADAVIANEIECSFAYNTTSKELLESSNYDLEKGDLLKVVEVLGMENSLHHDDIGKPVQN